MNNKDLIKLKKKVDTAEYEEQQLKGERKATLANLKEDFDCSDIEEGKELRKKLKKKYQKLVNALEQKLIEIEKEYLPDEED